MSNEEKVSHYQNFLEENILKLSKDNDTLFVYIQRMPYYDSNKFELTYLRIFKINLKNKKFLTKKVAEIELNGFWVDADLLIRTVKDIVEKQTTFWFSGETLVNQEKFLDVLKNEWNESHSFFNTFYIDYQNEVARFKFVNEREEIHSYIRVKLVCVENIPQICEKIKWDIGDQLETIKIAERTIDKAKERMEKIYSALHNQEMEDELRLLAALGGIKNE